MHPDTQAVHGGHSDDKIGSVVPPINLSTTFERDEAGRMGGKGFIYTRMDNPNRRDLEKKLALLEGGTDAFAFPSGMAAALALVQCVTEPGAHVIIPDDCYHGVSAMIRNMMPRWKVDFTAVDMTDPQNVEKAIRPGTRLILIETPSNPLLKITDIKAVADIAGSKNILSGCDNTWTTPLIQKPLALGVDLVFHSSTKFYGGHSDILGGCIVINNNPELNQRIRQFQVNGGVVPSPFDCWLLSRSLATLSVRLERQEANAEKIVQFLSSRKEIRLLHFPGLPSHPGHAIAKKQMNGRFGSMLSVQVNGGEEAALRFAGGMQLFKHATSLGGVESLIEHRRSAEGDNPQSPEDLLRISVGIEYIDDLLGDLEAGLKKI